jgi:DNA-binding NarL/FixJ family response regulator
LNGNRRKISIVVADDSAICRNNARLIIGLLKEMEVVAEAENGLAAIKQAQAYKPNSLLIDIRMPFIDGIDAIRIIIGALQGFECDTKLSGGRVKLS